MRRKDNPHPVRVIVNLSELQAQRVADMRQQYGLASDGDAIREMIDALFVTMDKDPLKG